MFLKTVFRLLRDEFFPNWIKGVISLFAFAVSGLTALGVFFKISELPSRFLPQYEPFLTYIWTTFLTSALFIAFTMILLQRLLRKHEELARVAKDREAERVLADRATKIQHRMTEAVRRAAILGPSYNLKAEIEDLLGSQLCGYLNTRLAGQHFHITVKCTSPQHGGDGRLGLKSMFRDKEQDQLRHQEDFETLSGNYIFERFIDAPIDESKQIYIPDIEHSSVNRTLRERAHSRAYKSLLAIPLKVPLVPEAPKVLSGVVGFLGIDSPEVNAFNGLFSGSSPPKPLEELNFLYGIADAIATILILCQHVAAHAPLAPTGSNAVASESD